MANQITFHDDSINVDRTGEIIKEFYIGQQKWQLVDVDSIQWLVPQGWPNASYPVCKESEPEGFRRMLLVGEIGTTRDCSRCVMPVDLLNLHPDSLEYPSDAAENRDSWSVVHGADDQCGGDDRAWVTTY